MIKSLKKQWVLWSVLLVTGLVELLRPYSVPWLIYQRDLLGSGELWRLLTGNFCHLGPSHWVLNMGGWVMGWLLYRSLFSNAQWLWLLLFASLAVGIGLWMWSDVHSYVGLSGTLHGVFVAAAIADVRFGWRLGGWLMLVAITGKLIYEQGVGSLPGTTQMSGGNVIVDAHLFGALGGLVVIVVMMWLRSVHRAATKEN